MRLSLIFSMKNTAIRAAREASKIVKDRFNQAFEVKIKGGNPLDLVTDVDVESEKKILGILKAAYPDHGFFSEEAGKSGVDSEYVWMIDPIDGTTNYSRGIPCFSVSIALVKNKEVVLGVVANPLADEVYWAEKGKGAWLNSQPIRVSTTTDLAKAFVSAEWWSRSGEYKQRGMELFMKLGERCAKIRYLSSTVWTLSRVARGLLDVETCDTTLLDVAAVGLIIKEAGGLLTDEKGGEIKPFDMEIKRVVVANPTLHSQVLKLI